MPLATCLQNGDGQGYFENFCSGSSGFARDAAALSTAAKKAVVSTRKH
jgi:hypothetical protein